MYKGEYLKVFRYSIYKCSVEIPETTEESRINYRFVLHFYADNHSCVLTSCYYGTIEWCVLDATEIMDTTAGLILQSTRDAVENNLNVKIVLQNIIYEINIKYISAVQARDVELRRASVPTPCEPRGVDISRRISKIRSRRDSSVPKLTRTEYQENFRRWENIDFSFDY